MTKTKDNRPDRPGNSERVAYLARFLVFFGFGVYGSGGLLSIARSRSSERFIASSFGSKSSASTSRLACRSDNLLAVIAGISWDRNLYQLTIFLGIVDEWFLRQIGSSEHCVKTAAECNHLLPLSRLRTPDVEATNLVLLDR